MIVMRTDYWNTIRPTYSTYHPEIIFPFSYTTDTLSNNPTLYYGCQASPIEALLAVNGSIKNTNVTGYFVTRKVSDITNYEIACALSSLPEVSNTRTSEALSPTTFVKRERLVLALNDGERRNRAELRKGLVLAISECTNVVGVVTETATVWVAREGR
ncbi:hypothetical protein NL676_028336 [Syzygium grande]|nr:hypothetical protein NL676_028336 [Syzygium grande]